MKIHAFVREVAPRVIAADKHNKGKFVFHCMNLSGMGNSWRAGMAPVGEGEEGQPRSEGWYFHIGEVVVIVWDIDQLRTMSIWGVPLILAGLKEA
jgi:hypothetical protein